MVLLRRNAISQFFVFSMIEKSQTPGDLIALEIKRRNLQQKTVAGIACIEPTNLNRMIKGTRPIDPDSALRLELAIGLSAKELLQCQMEQDLKRATEKFSSEIEGKIKTGREVFSLVPVAEMISRGWLPNVSVSSNVESLKKEVENFFDVDSLGSVSASVPHAAKKTDAVGQVTPAQIAWLGRAKQVAKALTLSVLPYSSKQFPHLIDDLRPLLEKAENICQATEILARYGIRLIFVERLKSSKIDGACLWLDESSPVVAMSLRYDRIDNFWFVLRHELEHVCHGDGKQTPNIDSVDAMMACEAAANVSYSTFIDPNNSIQEFISNSRLSAEGILSLADRLHLHPGLVVGRIQFLTHRYGILRNLQVKIRQLLIEARTNVDGWGFDVVQSGRNK